MEELLHKLSKSEEYLLNVISMIQDVKSAIGTIDPIRAANQVDHYRKKMNQNDLLMEQYMDEAGTQILTIAGYTQWLKQNGYADHRQSSTHIHRAVKNGYLMRIDRGEYKQVDYRPGEYTLPKALRMLKAFIQYRPGSFTISDLEKWMKEHDHQLHPSLWITMDSMIPNYIIKTGKEKYNMVTYENDPRIKKIAPQVIADIKLMWSEFKTEGKRRYTAGFNRNDVDMWLKYNKKYTLQYITELWKALHILYKARAATYSAESSSYRILL